MKEETVEDLMTMMSWRQDKDTDLAEQASRAFNEFCRRYKDHVWKAANILAKQSFKNDVDAASDICSDTLYNAYEIAGQFQPSLNADVNSGMRAWLYGIARIQSRRRIRLVTKDRQYLNYVDDFDKVLLDELSTDVKSNGVDVDEQSDWRKNQLRNALDALSEKKYSVLMTWFEFEENGKLPSHLIVQLSKLHSVKPDSLRQIKKRALTEVIDFIQSRSVLQKH